MSFKNSYFEISEVLLFLSTQTQLRHFQQLKPSTLLSNTSTVMPFSGVTSVSISVKPGTSLQVPLLTFKKLRSTLTSLTLVCYETECTGVSMEELVSGIATTVPNLELFDLEYRPHQVSYQYSFTSIME